MFTTEELQAIAAACQDQQATLDILERRANTKVAHAKALYAVVVDKALSEVEARMKAASLKKVEEAKEA